MVINVPKLKTHKKVGLTGALKNLVGINGHKDWLPHHRCGSIREGGDEYPLPSPLKRMETWLNEGIYRHPDSLVNVARRLGCRAMRRLNRLVSNDHIYEGSWYGNDTCWRMVLDLNRILVYGSCDGQMTDKVQRKLLTIVDAIIAGEGNGPMTPDPRNCNMLVAGENPAAVDAVLATVIGFDYRRLPLISSSFSPHRWPITDFPSQAIDVRSTDPRFCSLRVGEGCESFEFRAPSSWVGHIEMDARTGNGAKQICVD